MKLKRKMKGEWAKGLGSIELGLRNENEKRMRKREMVLVQIQDNY